MHGRASIVVDVIGLLLGVTSVGYALSRLVGMTTFPRAARFIDAPGSGFQLFWESAFLACALVTLLFGIRLLRRYLRTLSVNKASP